MLDRIGLIASLEGLSIRDIPVPEFCDTNAVRARYRAMADDGAALAALTQAALAFGVASLRMPLFALRAARASAALDGRDAPDESDLALAAALVIAPRATRLPAPPPQESQEASPPEPSQNPESEAEQAKTAERPLEEMVLEAVRAALPEKLLAALIAEAGRAVRSGSGQGQERKAALRGRPAGVLRGDPRNGRRLAVLDTLRAAAPWQRLRGAERQDGRLAIRKDDFRIKRFRERSETETIFVVDASGSAALHRLAEAKGAVECCWPIAMCGAIAWR